MDGGFYIDMIDVLVKTYGMGLPADGQIAQSFQSTARAGWRRFSLAVQLSTGSQTASEPLDGGKGFESIVFLRKTASSQIRVTI
jgi:hypothetical protein